MTTQSAPALDEFQWSPQPEAARFVWSLVNTFLDQCPAAKTLATRMHDETGTRFFDWVAHIVIPRRDPRAADLASAGYIAQESLKSATIFTQEAGIFPTILVSDGPFEIAIKAEYIADYLAANDLALPIAGDPLAEVRYAKICTCEAGVLSVIERHGNRSFNFPVATKSNATKRLPHLKKFRTRQRIFDNDEQGFDHANSLI